MGENAQNYVRFKKYKLFHLTHNSKKFNIKIIINLNETITKSKTDIRILNLYINEKFR